MKLNINGKELEISDELISTATPDTVIEYKTDAFSMRTTEEDSLYKSNIYREAHGSGIEIGRKNILKGLGLESDGAHKDDTKSLELVNSFINSKVSKEVEVLKIEPNKKIDELTKDLSLLKNNIEVLSKEKEVVTNSFFDYKKNQTINSTFSNIIPDNTILPKEDIMLILRTKINADIDELGNPFAIGSDGMPLKNSVTLDKMPLKDVVVDFFKNNPQYLKGATGGASGTDSADKGNKQDVDSFIKEMQDKGVALNGHEFNTEMKKRTDAGLLAI